MANKQFNPSSSKKAGQPKTPSSSPATDDFWSEFEYLPQSSNKKADRPNNNAPAGPAAAPARDKAPAGGSKTAPVSKSEAAPKAAKPAPVAGPANAAASSKENGASSAGKSSSKESSWSAGTSSANAQTTRSANNFSSFTGSRMVLPLLVLAVAIVVTAFILPGMDAFSHVVDVSGSDSFFIPEYDDGYIAIGDEGAQVTKLQNQLVKLEYLSTDNITGVYDNATYQALEVCCTDNGISLSAENDRRCPQDVYDAVMKISVDKETTTTTETPTTTTTQSTTAPTEPVAENYVVRIKNSTKLYRQPNTKTEALYWLDAGNQYNYLEEMMADGRLWYRVQYSISTTGWLIAENADKIPQE